MSTTTTNSIVTMSLAVAAASVIDAMSEALREIGTIVIAKPNQAPMTMEAFVVAHHKTAFAGSEGFLLGLDNPHSEKRIFIHVHQSKPGEPVTLADVDRPTIARPPSVNEASASPDIVAILVDAVYQYAKLTRKPAA